MGEESGVTSEGPRELGRVPLLFFWDSGDTKPTPSVGVGKGQAGSRKVSGKQKDSFLVIAGIPATRLLVYCKPGLPWWLSGQESSRQGRRGWFDPWVGKIPWRRKWQPTPVFLPGKSHGQENPTQRVRHD